uniref:Uncharacterized protein n=1 Tax=Vitrella brassicaformis TaxID=1169539 RepID=A0A7S1NWG1_9ALVE
MVHFSEWSSDWSSDILAVVALMFTLRLLQSATLNPHIGPLILAVQQMVPDKMKFLFLYLFIHIASLAGLCCLFAALLPFVALVALFLLSLVVCGPRHGLDGLREEPFDVLSRQKQLPLTLLMITAGHWAVLLLCRYRIPVGCGGLDGLDGQLLEGLQDSRLLLVTNRWILLGRQPSDRAQLPAGSHTW